MTFTHTYGKYRIFKSTEQKIIDDFPLLLNFEYVLVGNTNIEVDSSKLDNNEILAVVKARVNGFITENDNNLKSSFLDNISFYSKEIGFENTVDILIPILKKIKNENDSIKIKFLVNIPKLVNYLYSQKGYVIIRDQILPIISGFFNNPGSARVIDQAFEAFIEVSNYISDEDKGLHVLNTVICKFFYFTYLKSKNSTCKRRRRRKQSSSS